MNNPLSPGNKEKDPRSLARDTTLPKDGNRNARSRSALRQRRLPGSSAPGPATASGGEEAGNPGKEDGCPGLSRSGSTARREEAFREEPSHNGGRTLATSRDGWEVGNGEAKEPIPMIGDPGSFREEARQWRPSEDPIGANKKVGKRGGLVGSNPETLCGEAPKGQPMICRETLEVVCAEAPQGQPRNHRPQNQHMSRPTGEITGTPRGQK